MKIVKRILIAVVAIIVVLLIVGLFLKKDFNIEREITINKPKQDVFAYIVLLKNQDNYSKWAKMDPNMKKGFTGTDGTVGCVTSWESESKDVGSGEQEVKKITPGERIDYELRFLKPFKATNTAYLATEAVSPVQTKVKWGFHGHMQYPFNIMCMFMNMDKMIGDDLSTGLTNLKGILEK